MKKIFFFLGALIAVSNGQDLDMNWVDNLTGSLNQLNRNIQANVRNLNRQIENYVRQSVTNMDLSNQLFAKKFGKFNNGQTVIMNSGTGNSQVILSGFETDGKPYFRVIEETTTNNQLKHIEKIYNSTSDKFDMIGYTRDLANPAAPPIPITFR